MRTRMPLGILLGIRAGYLGKIPKVSKAHLTAIVFEKLGQQPSGALWNELTSVLVQSSFGTDVGPWELVS